MNRGVANYFDCGFGPAGVPHYCHGQIYWKSCMIENVFGIIVNGLFPAMIPWVPAKLLTPTWPDPIPKIPKQILVFFSSGIGEATELFFLDYSRWKRRNQLIWVYTPCKSPNRWKRDWSETNGGRGGGWRRRWRSICVFLYRKKCSQVKFDIWHSPMGLFSEINFFIVSNPISFPLECSLALSLSLSLRLSYILGSCFFKKNCDKFFDTHLEQLSTVFFAHPHLCWEKNRNTTCICS